MYFKLVRLAVPVVFLTFLCLSSVNGGDWPNYRGPNHDGISLEKDWSSDWGSEVPKVLWRASVGNGFSSIAVADGRAYMMGNTGTKKTRNDDADIVFCVDAETGKEIWRYKYDCPLEPKYYPEGGTLSSPTYDDGRVYTLSKMGDLFCFEADTGKIIWQKQLNEKLGFKHPTWHFSSSGLIQGDLLIYNMGTAGLALDKKSGEVVWENGKNECGYATPVPYKAGQTDCVAIFGKDSVMGVSVADGKVVWDFTWKTKYDVNSADPIVFGNKVFISSGYNRGCALIEFDGGEAKEIWENKEMRNHMNCSVLWEGHLYGFDESTLKCIDVKDGSEKWSDKSMGKGALMMSADGRLIIMSDNSELVIAKADPSGFEALGRSQILSKKRCWTVPVLANEKIYARNAEGEVACVDVSGQ